MSKFPTWYTDKGSADSTDKIWASDTSTNFNITVDEIWDEVFTDRDTDNLSEWSTNKYASTTNVNAAWATMNADTDLSWNDWFLDEDDFASDSATKVPSQQSVKEYIANNLPSATTTSEWVVELAIDAEVVTWTDETRYINSKQVKDNYTQQILEKRLSASDSLKWSADTEQTETSNAWTLKKEIKIRTKWVVRVKFDLKDNDPWIPWLATIYINWITIWTERSATDTYVTHSEDITVEPDDLVQLYVDDNDSLWLTYIRNFRIYYDIGTSVIWTVNLD